MTNEVQEVSLDLIDDPVFAMRSEVGDDSIDELVRSIKRHGLINPVMLRRVGERYEVVAGHRRTLACRSAGLVFISAVVTGADDGETLVMRAHENYVRRDTNPLEDAVFFGRLISERGYTKEQILEEFDLGETWLNNRLALLDFPDYLLVPVASRKIPVGAAIALNKIQDEATKRNFVDIAAKDGITLERANAWVSMAAVGAVGSGTTEEQLKAMAAPEQHNETLITCAKCQAPSKMGSMVTVWIHKECPPSAE